MSKQKPLMVAFIVDVSSSMRRNWGKKSQSKKPRIEAIRDSLNQVLGKIQVDRKISGDKRPEIYTFCLGMGFKTKEKLGGIQLDGGKEEPDSSEIRDINRVDLVCDVLALIDIIPTKHELDALDDFINQRWNEYARKFLSRVIIDSDIEAKLQILLADMLRSTALRKLRANPWYQMLSFLGPSGKFAGFPILREFLKKSLIRFSRRKDTIEERAVAESQRFLRTLHHDAERIFLERRAIYERIIVSSLSGFVDDQTSLLLDLLTLGHPVTKVFESFGEVEVSNLAQRIYSEIDKDVRESFTTSWLINGRALKKASRKLGARVNMIEIERESEEVIKTVAWSSHLKTYVHARVNDLFKSTFRKKARAKFPEWTKLAASHQVIRRIDQIKAILPDVLEDEIYTDQLMFGSTPIDQAMAIASLRLMDEDNSKLDRTLVIISDGEFDTPIQERVADLLKDAGVTIICCLLSNKNVTRSLPVKVDKSWPRGAAKLFSLSSRIQEEHVLSNSLSSRGFVVNKSANLFFQLNYSDRLESLLDAILGG